MNLKKKKALAAKLLKAGKGRVIFHPGRLEDINHALTKQDILDLFNNGSIIIKPVKGRKTGFSIRVRRRGGSIRQRVRKGKREYVFLTRKLRRYLAELKKQKKITSEQYSLLRKELRASQFKSKSHLKEHLALMKI